MSRDVDPRAQAAAQEQYDELLEELEAARSDGDMASVRRLERRVDEARRLLRKLGRTSRGSA